MTTARHSREPDRASTMTEPNHVNRSSLVDGEPGQDSMEPGPASTGLTIGALRLPGRFVLAPLAGVSDWPFRSLALANGAALAYTEMISSEGLVRGGKATLKMLERAPTENLFAPQLFGSHAGRMADAAQMLESMGAALVDLNMGCPVKKVCRTGAGAALMREPRRLEAIVRAVVDRVSIPVQVKIRAGWDSTSINATEIASRVEDAGASAIAVHGRTKAQGYGGKASWDLIAEVKAALRRMTVIGNGDVLSARDALRKLQGYGVDGVMIGRGALGNPWIFREIDALARGRDAAPVVAHGEWREIIHRHLDGLIAYRGDERRAVRMLRKHLVWYTRGMRGAPSSRSEIASIRTKSDVGRWLDQHFPPSTGPARPLDGAGPRR